MFELIAGLFKGPHINAVTADILARGVVIALIIVISVLTNFLVKRPILAFLTNIISRTQTTWDDTFLEKRVLNQLAHLAPAMVIYVMAPLALEGYEKAIALYCTQGSANLYDSSRDFSHQCISQCRSRYLPHLRRCQRDSNQGLYPGCKDSNLFS